MLKRLSKQITILAIFLIIALGSIFLLYFAFKGPSPTCFDNILNQGEKKADCGGPCEPCEEDLQEDLVVLDKRFIPLGNNVYDVVARVKNPNHEFGSEEFTYQFDLKDEAGNIIAKRRDKDFIMPGEIKYIIESNIKGAGVAESISLSMSDYKWKRLSDISDVILDVRNKEYHLSGEGETGYSRVTGVVRNMSNFGIDDVVVNVLLKDRQGDIIGVNKTKINTLLSKEDRFFAAIWYLPPIGEVQRVEVEAETNLFLNDNFLREHGELKQFQEY